MASTPGPRPSSAHSRNAAQAGTSVSSSPMFLLPCSRWVPGATPLGESRLRRRRSSRRHGTRVSPRHSSERHRQVVRAIEVCSCSCGRHGGAPVLPAGQNGDQHRDRVPDRAAQGDSFLRDLDVRRRGVRRARQRVKNRADAQLSSTGQLRGFPCSIRALTSLPAPLAGPNMTTTS